MHEKDNKQEHEDTMNLKRIVFSSCLILLLATALPLRAQTGCVDSLEDPTIFLALAGGAGALIAGIRAARNREK